MTQSKQCKVCLVSNVHSLHPAHVAGLFFCLASDTVQGFYFAQMQYSPIQAFTAGFAVSMQLYRPRLASVYTALQRLFLRLYPLNLRRYRPTQAAIIPPAPHWRAYTRPDTLNLYPRYHRHAGRCTGQHRPPIIIRYIRGQTMPAAAGQLLPCADRWQVLTRCQQYRPGAPAEGSASPPVQGQPDGLHSGTGSVIRAGRSGTLHPAGQSSGRGAAGGAEPLAATAASHFGLSPDS